MGDNAKALNQEAPVAQVGEQAPKGACFYPWTLGDFGALSACVSNFGSGEVDPWRGPDLYYS